MSHLLQFPVELSGSESVDLSEISSEQKHQAAVVDVQRVMVAVHFCKKKHALLHKDRIYMRTIKHNSANKIMASSSSRTTTGAHAP